MGEHEQREVEVRVFLLSPCTAIVLSIAAFFFLSHSSYQEFSHDKSNSYWSLIILYPLMSLRSRGHNGFTLWLACKSVATYWFPYSYFWISSLYYYFLIQLYWMNHLFPADTWGAVFYLSLSIKLCSFITLNSRREITESNGGSILKISGTRS